MYDQRRRDSRTFHGRPADPVDYWKRRGENDDEPLPCPGCDFLTMDDDERGSFAICPVCYWEDDDIQVDDPTRSGGANRVSLEEVRKNFSAFGACEESEGDHVRPPRAEERP